MADRVSPQAQGPMAAGSDTEQAPVTSVVFPRVQPHLSPSETLQPSSESTSADSAHAEPAYQSERSSTDTTPTVARAAPLSTAYAGTRLRTAPLSLVVPTAIASGSSGSYTWEACGRIRKQLLSRNSFVTLNHFSYVYHGTFVQPSAWS